MWDWLPFSWLRQRPSFSRRSRPTRLRVEELESRTVLSVIPGPAGVAAPAFSQASLVFATAPAPAEVPGAILPGVSVGEELAFAPVGGENALQVGSPLLAFSPVDTLMAMGVNPSLAVQSMPLRATSGRLDGGGGYGGSAASDAGAADAFWEGYADDPRIPEFRNVGAEPQEAVPGGVPVVPVEHAPAAPAPLPAEGSGREGGEGGESAPPPASPPTP